jgi:hypothetical protein
MKDAVPLMTIVAIAGAFVGFAAPIGITRRAETDASQWPSHSMSCNRSRVASPDLTPRSNSPSSRGSKRGQLQWCGAQLVTSLRARIAAEIATLTTA